MSGARLIANFGAEESGFGSAASEPQTFPVGAGLWRALFGADARFLDPAFDAEPWPAALGEPPETGVFRGLEDAAVYAWINTPRVAEAASAAGLGLSGAAPAIVREVHDKAFAHGVAVGEGRLPEVLRERSVVFGPDDLADPEAARARIEAIISDWPAALRDRFTLKPRLGTSGRGRVPGRDGRVDAGPGAFERLADVGGALLEPWLERTRDWSTSLWIDPNGELTLLGTTEIVVDPSGLYRGHRGTLDSKGRVTSGGPWDETLRESAVEVARAAAVRGYHGPCGIDAFTFRDGGREVLRPVVEFNARFTFGIVVLGLLRRALRILRRQLRLQPNERREFQFALDASEDLPDDEWRTFELVRPIVATSPRLAVRRVECESIR